MKEERSLRIKQAMMVATGMLSASMASAQSSFDDRLNAVCKSRGIMNNKPSVEDDTIKVRVFANGGFDAYPLFLIAQRVAALRAAAAGDSHLALVKARGTQPVPVLGALLGVNMAEMRASFKSVKVASSSKSEIGETKPTADLLAETEAKLADYFQMQPTGAGLAPRNYWCTRL